jgi:integrase
MIHSGFSRLPPGIYKRGRICWITYMLKGHRHVCSTRSSDLRVAINQLQRIKGEITQGRITISPSRAPLLSEVLRDYVEQIENPNTQKRYRLAADALLRYLGDPCISDLTPFMFDKFKEIRLKAGVTSAGVNRELALGRASLNLAVDRRQVPYSPFDGVKLSNEANHRKQPRTLSFVEESKILACCDLRLGTLFKVLNDSGLRVGVEALPIKRSNVDFEDGTITVVHSKTAAGRRAVPMTERCKTALLEWCSATNGMSEYVFFNRQKLTTYIRRVKTAWRNALRAAGIAHFPIYNCRHTFATRLAAAGARRDH